ncbi:MAG: WD40 repeat domain-containing protein [Bacteroidales bacterium]|nr:WD40 repeat domain-containing protein [Bacteroidales bacterium]
MRLYFLFFIPLLANTFAQDEKYLLHQLKNHKDGVRSLEYSPSGEFIASGGDDKSVCIYNILNIESAPVIIDNYFPVNDIEFFGEDKLFVSSGNAIKLIDKSGNKLALFEGNSTHFWSVDFAPERNKITGGSYDRKIRIWDVSAQQVELVLEGHEKNILAVAFSKDEQYVVSGSLDLSIKVWNAKTGTLLKTLKKHSENIYDIKFHPNSRYFASASGDKTIRLWDIDSGKVVKTYSGHGAAVVDIEFSPDGYFLYSASPDGSVIVWEVATGAKLYSYVLHDGDVNSVAVSPDGNYVATGGKDGVVYIWRSAKYIAADFYFEDDFRNDINTNPVFAPKKRDETKQTYAERQNEATLVLNDIVEAYFEKYKKRLNYKYLPD